LVGTVNQLIWAEQIRARVSAEFDRVAKALESRKPSQTEQHQSETCALIAILEDKRTEVMAHDQAGYFIHDWQELQDQVRRAIIEDPRYLAIKSNGAAATDSTRHFASTEESNSVLPLREAGDRGSKASEAPPRKDVP